MKSWTIFFTLTTLVLSGCKNTRCDFLGDCPHVCPTLNGPARVAGWEVQKVKMSRTDLFNFQFPDTAVGFAKTFSGRLQKTIDGGQNWLALNGSSSFNDVFFFVSKNHGWQTKSHFLDFGNGQIIAAKTGQLFETTDGGDTWNPLGDTLKQTFTSLHFRDELAGFATSLHDSISPSGQFFQRAELLRTADGGLNWQVVAGVEPATFSFQVAFFGDKFIFLNGEYPHFWRSADDGLTWEKINFSQQFNQAQSIFFVSETRGFMNAFGQVQQTKDGGRNWLSLPVLNPATMLQFSDENNGLVFAQSRNCSESSAFSFFGTTDGGQTWEESLPIFFDQNSFFGNLQRIDFPEKGAGFAIFNQQLLKIRKR